MNDDTDRQVALAAVQMRLFDLAKERKSLKRQVMILIAAHKKQCRHCREEMHAEQFYYDDRYSDLLYPYCRECKTTMVKTRQAA